MSIDINAKAMIVCSLSGATVRMVSRFRCPVDIIGMTVNEKTWHQLAMSWGVTPVLSEEYNSVEVLFYRELCEAKRIKNLQKGDNVILTGGQINGRPGHTNILKLETVK